MALQTDILKTMSKQDFLNLGKDNIFYIRPVQVNHVRSYGLFNANGEQISLYQNYQEAQHAAWLHDITPLPLH